MTKWLGIDIGGANIKLATINGYAQSIGFELWRRRGELASILSRLLRESPDCDAIAATMTGELADCYASKREGVTHIVDCLHQSAGNRQVEVYSVEGAFRSVAQTKADALPAAASNWHALASYAVRYLEGRGGLVIDIGSTTSDVIPITNGLVATDSKTDVDRLAAGELVYTGFSRTPLCAITSEFPFRGQLIPVAAEFFATTADVYTLLGWTTPEHNDSADGRDFSQQSCVDRLARQICADSESFSVNDAIEVCHHVHKAQIRVLRDAVAKVIEVLATDSIEVIISGSGEKLAAAITHGLPMVRQITPLSELVGVDQSSCAAAVAVAALAEDRQV